ncbi:hypothetical protein, partial [Zhenpiania hominis]|uniref:hypothetical protein n=1 Tax=Zhenpiania hominis TaxID=2763644 RepID=UPI0039F4E40E
TLTESHDLHQSGVATFFICFHQRYRTEFINNFPIFKFVSRISTFSPCEFEISGKFRADLRFPLFLHFGSLEKIVTNLGIFDLLIKYPVKIGSR